MNNATDMTQVGCKRLSVVGQAEKAYICNILIPEFAIFLIGITSGFVTLLSIFS